MTEKNEVDSRRERETVADAAPALLAACKGALEVLLVEEGYTNDGATIRTLAAAIALAEGRKSEEKQPTDEMVARFAGLEARHDMLGFYMLTGDEAAHEDDGNPSVGFDGRPHYATLEEAWRAAAEYARQ